MERAPIEAFEKLLAGGRDGVMLRFGLGNELLKSGRPEAAIAHLQRAVELDPAHSASWKLLGKALAAAGREPEALAVYERGMLVAREKGDLQAMKEMEVMARRLRRTPG